MRHTLAGEGVEGGWCARPLVACYRRDARMVKGDARREDATGLFRMLEGEGMHLGGTPKPATDAEVLEIGNGVEGDDATVFGLGAGALQIAHEARIIVNSTTHGLPTADDGGQIGVAVEQTCPQHWKSA